MSSAFRRRCRRNAMSRYDRRHIRFAWNRHGRKPTSQGPIDRCLKTLPKPGMANSLRWRMRARFPRPFRFEKWNG